MPSTLVVAGAAFLGGMATSSMPSSTKSRALAHAKKTNPFKLHDFTVPEPGGPPSGAPLRVTPATPDPRATQNPNATQVAGGDWRHW